MGGPGSGQWSRWDKRPTLEELCSLDIRLLKRRGTLEPGRSTRLTWCRGAQSADSVWVLGTHDAVVLVYRARVGLGSWEDKRDRVPLTWTAPHGGGQRPWFLCPACARRVALLYSVGMGFVCRHCTQRPYGSQCETPQDRRLRKVRTIRTRLGVSHNLTQPINAWHKPKGMHWRTFKRLMAQEEHAQLAVWHHQHAWSTRMLGEIGETSAEGGEARGAV
jgi:hypothetical protein